MRLGIRPVVCDSADGSCFVTWADTSTGKGYRRKISSTGAMSGESLFSDANVNGNPVTSVKGGSIGGALGANTYLFAWDTGSEVRGSIINRTDGSVISANFVIATKTPIAQCPGNTFYNPVDIAFDGTNYLVTWNYAGNDATNCDLSSKKVKWDVLARFIDETGAAVGSPFQVNSAGNGPLPTAAFDGSNYFVVWSDYRNDADRDSVCDAGEGTCADVYGQYISKSGVLVGSQVVINNEAGDQLGGLTGFNDGKYLVTVNTGSGMCADIANCTPDGVFVTP